MPYDDRAPRNPLAEAFADRIATLARERDAPAASIPALREAAWRASQATTEGRVCLPVGEIGRAAGQGDEDLRRLLLESKLVGTDGEPRNLPLVLDDENRLYLHRYFDYERRLAQRLMARANAPIEPIPSGLRSQLDALFAANAKLLGDRVDWQKLAVAFAMLRNLTIISGGPGTGKTTTVVNLLACLVAQRPSCRIKLAAPTGKAAARMLEAIRAGTHRLAPAMAANLPAESFTLHRLLGASADGRRFRHHAANPLALDVLVVDEASMLDLALATQLFEAVPDSAKLVLLGDKDQLAAVEAGSVFAEVSADPNLSDAMRMRLGDATGIDPARIVTAAPLHATPLRDCVAWFNESFRFGADSGIGRLAAMINAGEAEATVEWLRTGSDPAVTWIDDAGRTPAPRTLARIHDGYRPYLEAVRHNADPGILFATFNRFRVLCAERQGPRGVAGMNGAISEWFRAELPHPLDPGSRSPWYPGRPVMVLRNDYVLGLYNGDVGIVLPRDDGTLVVYALQSNGTLREVPPARLPQHESAFAMTVHKAQGNEYDTVQIIVPARPSSVCTQELLYTAVTRASSSCTLVADAETLAAQIRARAPRQTSLLAQVKREVALPRDVS